MIPQLMTTHDYIYGKYMHLQYLRYAVAIILLYYYREPITSKAMQPLQLQS